MARKPPVAEVMPAATSEPFAGLPKWCRGVAWISAQRKLTIRIALPAAGVLQGLARAGLIPPHLATLAPNASALPVDLELDPAAADAVVSALTRCLEESRRVIIEAH